MLLLFRASNRQICIVASIESFLVYVYEFFDKLGKSVSVLALNLTLLTIGIEVAKSACLADNEIVNALCMTLWLSIDTSMEYDP